MPLVQCAYCEEWFGGTTAFDRHLRVRRETVTTPGGHVVPNEQIVTCRTLAELGEVSQKTGLPRLVPTMRRDRRVWVTRLRDARTVPDVYQRA